MRLYDISHPLSSATAFWPGDAPFTFQPTARLAEGASVNLSAISLSPHNGTHADAPYHYDDAGLTMDQVPLERYLGPARLVALEGREQVSEADLRALDLTGVERLLVRTGSCPDPTVFNEQFTFFDAGAVAYLSGLGVRLLGTDAHSVDAMTSKDLPAHNACRTGGILILENLNLSGVPTGDYELIALPLRIVAGDGSPVRAVLREIR